MCDTIVALPSVTKDKKVYFAKNSDREPNEAHILEVIQAADHLDGDEVTCTYKKIPQVKHTNAILLAKPYWIWGAEMGVNEFGIAIGNEAIFSKIPAKKKPGLIGMDFLRLGLERSKAAEEAMHVIIEILEEYGQSGNCSASHGLYYHNSYLIADRNSAWVLETVDKNWAALRVKDFYTISNALTIDRQWDMISEDLIEIAIDNGWCKNRKEFSFKNCYSDYLFTNFSQAKKRRGDTFKYLRNNVGNIDIYKIIDLLRLHEEDSENWSPDKSLTDWTVCVHKGFGPIRASQTVGSMVARLSQGGDSVLCTGTSAPCTSIFKPVWIESGIPEFIKKPNNHFDVETLWWRHEMLHREILKDYSNRIKLISDDIRIKERKFIEKTLDEKSMQNINGKRKLTQLAFIESDTLEDEWLGIIKKQNIKNKAAFYYRMEWNKHDREAGINFNSKKYINKL